MQIDIRNVHFKVDEKTKNYAQEKISKLHKYYKNIIKATLVFEKHTGDTANVRYCFAVELDVPGNNIRVEECDKNIKAAINKVEKKLKERLIREKGLKNPSRIHKAKNWVKGFFGNK